MAPFTALPARVGSGWTTVESQRPFTDGRPVDGSRRMVIADVRSVPAVLVSVSGDDLLARLKRERLLAIVRTGDPDAALAVASTLIRTGVPLLEVSLTTPGALGVIQQLVKDFDGSEPRLCVGAGTVLSAEQARQAADAGATFLVTPALTPALEAAASLGLPVLAGAVTPTEVLEALRRGATAVKLFPAGQVGAAGYLKALREPLPDVPFVPVGGVDETSVPQYLAAGAVAVGVGSPLVADAAHGGDLGALADRARRFLALVAETG